MVLAAALTVALAAAAAETILSWFEAKIIVFLR
jgi:hypothetical protein